VSVDVLKLIQETAFEPAPRTPLAVLLADVVLFVRRFVVLDDAQAAAVALWIAHTHTFAAFDCSPYLSVQSPEKRSGKSRVLDVLELLAARPWRVVMPTEAVVYRKIARDAPTLLLDEVDAIWQPAKRGDNHEGLRALLNAGNQAGVRVPRCAGPQRDELVEFETYSPKALAGIGRPPDTVADRAVVIRMKRRTRSEPIERFRRRELAEEAEELRGRLAAWAEEATAELEQARPLLPDELDDRALDAWEPLLAIAEATAGAWPERIRQVAVTLSGSEQREDESLGVRLLADVYRVFHPGPADENTPAPEPLERLWTTALLDALHGDEEAPWASYGRKAKPLTASQLARLLRPFGVHSQTIRIDETTAKGYLRESFEEAWQRYVTAETESEPSHRHNPHGYAENAASETSPPDDAEEAANPHGYSDVTALRLESGNSRNGRFCDVCVSPRVCSMTRRCVELDRRAAEWAEKQRDPREPAA
jgi:hypothetical protein